MHTYPGDSHAHVPAPIPAALLPSDDGWASLVPLSRLEHQLLDAIELHYPALALEVDLCEDLMLSQRRVQQSMKLLSTLKLVERSWTLRFEGDEEVFRVGYVLALSPASTALRALRSERFGPCFLPLELREARLSFLELRLSEFKRTVSESGINVIGPIVVVLCVLGGVLLVSWAALLCTLVLIGLLWHLDGALSLRAVRSSPQGKMLLEERAHLRAALRSRPAPPAGRW